MPEPDRSDYVAARRAARTLALEETLVALYVYACQRCGQVQDHEPERCCGVVRSSLAVTRPGRSLPHLALPPLGRRCPAWIGPNVASRPPSPPGTLATPSVAEVASLAVRRCYEGLQSGRPAVSVRDVAALLKLQREIEHDEAVAERDAARRQMDEWRHGLWIIRNAVVRQQGQDAWAAISAEVRKLRPDNRQPGSRGRLPFGPSVIPAANPETWLDYPVTALLQKATVTDCVSLRSRSTRYPPICARWWSASIAVHHAPERALCRARRGLPLMGA